MIHLMGQPAASQPATTDPQTHIRSIRQTSELPNDPLSDQQWSFMSSALYAGAADIFDARHNAQESSVVVAVVDSGLRLNHEDFTTLPGYDFVSDPVVANDGNGRDADASDPGDWVDSEDIKGALSSGCTLTQSKWHGTAIAGIIGAQSENLTGIAGAARQVELLPVRITGKCGGYVRDLIDGIRWAAGVRVSGVPDNPNPARIINLSVGFPGACSTSLQQAIDDAVNNGAILVTAATNYGVNLDVAPHSPANCRNVLTVGATLRDGSLAHYSATGSALFLLGPGGSSSDGIITTDNDGLQEPHYESSYGYHYGTSLAAAHVSATLATLLSAEPGLSNPQLRVALRNSAVAATDSRCLVQGCGAGRLNTQRAVQLLMDGELSLPLDDKLLSDEPVPETLAASSGSDTGAGSASVHLLVLLLFMTVGRRKR